ncbi:MAG: hypothetical protein ACK50A_10635 [Sphingobacteriaceae bacterium]
MSFLIVDLTSKGLIFGADRNVTTIYSDGTQNQNTKTEKVLKWTNDKALIGFVGQGSIGNYSTTDFVKDFIKRYPDFKSLETISEILRSEVEAQRKIDEGNNKPEMLIFHIGGFETVNSCIVPKVYMVTNIHALDPKIGYTDVRKEFKSTEELKNYFPNIDPANFKSTIAELENKLEPFWFHQGFDLMTFNILHSSLKLAFKSLIQNHPKHKLPTTLEEWVKHSKMQILMYGSYFESFHPPDKLYVGGGADILSLEWK